MCERPTGSFLDQDPTMSILELSQSGHPQTAFAPSLQPCLLTQIVNPVK